MHHATALVTMMMAATALLAPGGVAALPDGEAPIVEASHAADLAAAAPILLTDEDDAAAAAAADSGDDADAGTPAQRKLQFLFSGLTALIGQGVVAQASESWGLPEPDFSGDWIGYGKRKLQFYPLASEVGYETNNIESMAWGGWGRKLQEAFTDAGALTQRKLLFDPFSLIIGHLAVCGGINQCESHQEEMKG